MTSSLTTVHRRPSPTVIALFLGLFASGFIFSFANARKDLDDDDSPKRNRDHFDEILLRPDPHGYDDNSQSTHEVLQSLRQIYHDKIRPLEEHFHYADLQRHVMSEADIHSKPIVLVVGPWSTGKSTLINYILGIEGQLERLYTGAEPTTADFTVLSYGDDYRTVEGLVLATDPTKPFSSMEKFGQTFLEHLLGIEINAPLLRNVTFIDTPGILENRRQQERGYPYNDVMRWLVQRADLIFVVFDPTKLDVGYELETLFKQLKGKESVIRIILNKADSISEQELMRVYGALFWSLSPLINVTEAPRVYVGSFWSQPYTDEELGDVLLEEEKSLLNDMYEVIRNRIYNKIAFLRQHAIRIRIHALLIDSYVAAYRKNKRFLLPDDELAKKIADDPIQYNVYKTILSHANISEYDLPDPREYEEFLQINPLTEQNRIDDYRSYFAKRGLLERINDAISYDLPKLLQRYQLLGESDGSKTLCKSKKGGQPCFSDIGTDLWAMQKRFPQSKQIFVDDEEETIISRKTKQNKYRKSEKRPVEISEKEEEQVDETESDLDQSSQEEEKDVEVEVQIKKSSTKRPKTKEQVEQKVPKPKVSTTIRKGKPKVVEQRASSEEEEEEQEETVTLTKPAITVTVSDHIEKPKDIREKVTVHVRETTKTETVEQVQSKRDESERAKIKKEHLDDSKMTQFEETGSSTDNVVKSKVQTGAAKEKRSTVEVEKKRDAGKVKSAIPEPPTDEKEFVKNIPVENLIKVTTRVPVASAGAVKKSHTKDHPTVEELIDEDDNKSAHPCNIYRKVCRPKTEQVTFESLTEKLSSYFTFAETEKPKCKIYRKSCQPTSDESPKVKADVKKASPKAEPEKPSKKTVPVKKEAKKEVEEEQKEGEQKCLPYRKTCVPIKRERPVVKAKDTSCKIYRKSCKVEIEAEKPRDVSDKKPTEKVKMEHKPKAKVEEKKEETKKEKPKKEEVKAKVVPQQEVKAPVVKEKYKKPTAEESEEKKEEKVKKKEVKPKPAEVKKAADKKSSEEKEEEEEEEKPLSAKFRYRKLREDLPEELKQKYIDKLEAFFRKAEAVVEEPKKFKKCPIYRKSCKAEPHVNMLLHTGEMVQEVMEKFHWLLSFTEHIFKVTPSKPKVSRKCPIYRKTCAGVVRKEGEIIEEKEVIPKCPLYRKSCKYGEEMREGTPKKEKREKETSSSEEDHEEKSGEVHESGSDENSVEPTSKRQAYDSREEEKERERAEKKSEESEEDEEEEKKVKVSKKGKDKSVEEAEPVKSETVQTTYRKKNIASATVAPVVEKETVQETTDKPLTAKERYRKKTEDMSTETEMSAKSEEVAESKSKQMTAKEKYRKQKPDDKSSTEQKESAEIPSKGKCPPYRKNCQDSSTEQTVEPATVKVPLKSTIRVHADSETKCLPYRKTCTPKVKSEYIETVASYPGRATEVGTKCLPYRKSCQKLQSSDKVTKEEQFVKHSEKLSKSSIPEKTRSIGQKCLPYRKSCTVQQTVSSDRLSNIDHKITHTPGSSSKESTTPCLIYRKSCGTAPAKKNLTNKDVIYVIDKETGKQKKLCRKKKNGDLNGNGVAPNAETLTSKIQNKWRKNAQMDSVIAA